MRFFLDTANVEEIKKANDMGVICGVTTNPSIIAKEGRDFNEVIKEIAAIVDGPISGEVKATTVDAEGMIKEGREIAKIHKNMVVKLPTTAEGLKACRVLSGEGIKTNLTLIFNVPQAILAARAGATYVSPFVGRIDDISMDGLQLIRDIAAVFIFFLIFHFFFIELSQFTHTFRLYYMHTKQKAFSYILFPLFSAGDGIPAFSFCINRQKFLFSQKQRAAKECLELFDGTLFSSSCQGDLNPRPPPYQGDALPTAP